MILGQQMRVDASMAGQNKAPAKQFMQWDGSSEKKDVTQRGESS
jgi:hypothetical protein